MTFSNTFSNMTIRSRLKSRKVYAQWHMNILIKQILINISSCLFNNIILHVILIQNRLVLRNVHLRYLSMDRVHYKKL
jgi:hypothetical protein